MADIATVEQAVANFLDAFNRLDWERFSACLSDNITVFYPHQGNPYRANGRAEAEAAFRAVFEAARSRGKTSLNITPSRTRIQPCGDCAVVTFHLDQSEQVGRRTLVFAREPEGWKIVHLHASLTSK